MFPSSFLGFLFSVLFTTVWIYNFHPFISQQSRIEEMDIWAYFLLKINIFIGQIYNIQNHYNNRYQLQQTIRLLIMSEIHKYLLEVFFIRSNIVLSIKYLRQCKAIAVSIQICDCPKTVQFRNIKAGKEKRPSIST